MAKTEQEIEVLEWLDNYYLAWLEHERRTNDLYPGIVEEYDEENQN